MMSDKDNNLLKSDILTVGSELSEKLNAIGVPNTFGKASEGKDNLMSIIRMTINGLDMTIEQIKEILKDYYNKSEVNTLLNGKSDTSHNHDSAYASKNHNHDTAYASKNHNHDTAYASKSHQHDGADVILSNSNDVGTEIGTIEDDITSLNNSIANLNNRIKSGKVSGISVQKQNVASRTVTHNLGRPNVPVVTLDIGSTSGYIWADTQVTVYSVTNNDFKVKIYNNTASNGNFSFNWVVVENFGDNILYAPLLNGTETVYTIPYEANGTSINFQPIISNNQLKDGAGYLSDGWDNTVNWELTFEYYTTGDNNGYLIIPKGTNSRDYNGIQQWYSNQLNFRVNGSSPSGNIRNATSTKQWINVKVTKVGYVWKVYYNDILKTTWDASSYSSIVDTWTTMCIGVDRNMSRNSAVIRNIIVKEI